MFPQFCHNTARIEGIISTSQASTIGGRPKHCQQPWTHLWQNKWPQAVVVGLTQGSSPQDRQWSDTLRLRPLDVAEDDCPLSGCANSGLE